MIGLDDTSFRAYCKTLGIDPEPYYQDPSKAILYNRTEDIKRTSNRSKVYIDLLDLEQGDTIQFTEKAYDEDEGTYEFALTAGLVTDQMPSEAVKLPRFTLAAVMPMDHVLDIASSCSIRRQNSAYTVNADLLADSTGTVSLPAIRKASSELDHLLSSSYGSGDYTIADLDMRREMQESSGKVINMIVVFLTGLLAVIGLSNVWASISGSLRQRRQEFAMLKSAGLSPRQLWNMLFLEGLSLGLKPLLLSIPLQVLILWAFLSINEVTAAEYLPYAPLPVIAGYTLLILAAVIGAYFSEGRNIQSENIITAIKDDTL